MNPFAKTDWAKNIKYLRWAAKVLKLVVIVNILLSVLAVCMSFSSNAVVINGNSIANTPGILTTGSFIFTTFVGIFIMYTAARGLELFADVAEKILTPSEQIPNQSSQAN